MYDTQDNTLSHPLSTITRPIHYQTPVGRFSHVLFFFSTNGENAQKTKQSRAKHLWKGLVELFSTPLILFFVRPPLNRFRENRFGNSSPGNALSDYYVIPVQTAYETDH